MAIQITTELNNGIVLNQGYFRIEKLSMDTDKNMLFFTGALYADQDAREAGKEPIIPNYYQNVFELEDRTVNLPELAYNHIKNLISENEREAALFTDMIDLY